MRSPRSPATGVTAMKQWMSIFLISVCFLPFQNCAPASVEELASEPESVDFSKALVESDEQPTEFRYIRSESQSSDVLSRFQKGDEDHRPLIDRFNGTVETLHQKSGEKVTCGLSEEFLASLDQVFESPLCEIRIDPRTVTCLAYTAPFAKLLDENGKTIGLLPEKMACLQSGQVFCGEANQKLEDLLRDLDSHTLNCQ